MTRLAASLFALALLMAGPGYAAQSWAVKTGSDLVRTYALPSGYAVHRIFYEPGTGLFMLGLTTPQDTRLYYRIATDQAAGQWVMQAPDETRFMALPPYGTQMFLSSGLLRATLPQNFDQPFGDYRAAVLLSENRYTKKAGRSGRYGATLYEETLGSGTAFFKVADDDNKTLFMIAEEYRGNSGETLFLWTPDGRYIAMMPPKETLRSGPVVLIAGPFAVRDAARVAEVNLRNSDADREMQEDGRLVRGEITAEQRYGFPYEAALRRLSACRDFLNNFGRPDKISLHNPLHALYFGDEKAIMGMRFRLGFTAGEHSGEIEIASPLLRTGNKSSLNDYFTVVTISTDKEKTDVFCPL